MKIDDIKKMAKQHGIKVSNLKKAELIKKIQLAEGHFDCFGSPDDGYCNQEECLWRSDCLKAA